MDQVVLEFSAGALGHVLRMVLHADRERIVYLGTATKQALERLGAKRDVAKAVRKLPDGSDQIDIGSFVAWLDKITPADKAAIGQLVLIDATIASRF